MKGLIFAMGLILCMATFANAQEGLPPETTPEERVKRKIAELEILKLSAEQKAKIKQVLMWSEKLVDSLWAAFPERGNIHTQNAKIRLLQEETTMKLTDLLTDEQMRVYNAIAEGRYTIKRSN